MQYNVKIYIYIILYKYILYYEYNMKNHNETRNRIDNYLVSNWNLISC